MSVNFRVTATKQDWDAVLGGWRCPVLKIPGATIEKAYAERSEVDSALYQVRQGDEIVRWAATGDPPKTIVFSIKLLKELSTQELTSKWKKLAIILPFLSPIIVAAVVAIFSQLPGQQKNTSSSQNGNAATLAITRNAPKGISNLESIESPEGWINDLINMFNSEGANLQNNKQQRQKPYYYQAKPYLYQAKEDTSGFLWRLSPSDPIYVLTARAFKMNTNKTFMQLPQKGFDKGIEFDVPQLNSGESLVLVMFVEWEQEKVVDNLLTTFISHIRN